MSVIWRTKTHLTHLSCLKEALREDQVSSEHQKDQKKELVSSDQRQKDQKKKSVSQGIKIKRSPKLEKKKKLV
jgi:hypothetical protein